ncbi:hypothetical protein H7F28_20165 [Brevibacterium sp. PAMC23299]|nr:hypothetical protein H7F28_20165 [Brevibacterium sp. PAMC23299]
MFTIFIIVGILILLLFFVRYFKKHENREKKVNTLLLIVSLFFIIIGNIGVSKKINFDEVNKRDNLVNEYKAKITTLESQVSEIKTGEHEKDDEIKRLKVELAMADEKNKNEIGVALKKNEKRLEEKYKEITQKAVDDAVAKLKEEQQVVNNSNNAVEEESEQQLAYDPFGPDLNCGDFATPADAQEVYIAAGGPGSDPHDLDRDNDGNACDWN